MGLAAPVDENAALAARFPVAESGREFFLHRTGILACSPRRKSSKVLLDRQGCRSQMKGEIDGFFRRMLETTA